MDESEKSRLELTAEEKAVRRKANKKENGRIWRAKNREIDLERKRLWSVENREYDLERKRLWVKNNPEKISENWRRYHESDHGKEIRRSRAREYQEKRIRERRIGSDSTVQGSVYAIEAVGTSFVKIGITKSGVAQRLIDLQHYQPFQLRVIASIEVSADLWLIEKKIHEFLQADRVRGEWFNKILNPQEFERLVHQALQAIA